MPPVRCRTFIAVVVVVIVFTMTGTSQKSPQPTTNSHSDKKEHKATLKWEPSPDAKKQGSKDVKYVIYRTKGTRNTGRPPSCDGKFEPLKEIDGNETTFVDHSVKANRVYCYAIATKIDGHEGRRSLVVIAVIPPDR